MTSENARMERERLRHLRVRRATCADLISLDSEIARLERRIREHDRKVLES